MDFGTKIKNAREDRDLSQREIAEQIPMNQSNYSKIERNLQEPNLMQLKRIVEILGLDIYDLLEIDPESVRRQGDEQFLKEIIALYRSKYPNAKL